MANTWRATAQAVTFANPKAMLDIYATASNARYYRLYRAYWFNNQYATVAGVVGYLSMTRITASSSGVTVSPIVHDTANSALDANFSSGYGRTVTVANTFRRMAVVGSDEVTPTTADFDALQTYVPFAEIWNSGYGDSNVEPLLIRASNAEGLCIYNATTSVGNGDFEMEFTDAAS